MVSKISEKIIKKIKEEKIVPIPRWRFVSWNVLLWLAISFAVVCAGLAISLIFADLADGDWDLRPRMGIDLMTYIWNTFPFLWVIIGLILIFMAYYELRFWAKSYKTSDLIRFIYVFSAILILSLVIYYSGWQNPVRKFLIDRVPLVKQIEERKQIIWNQPENGRLSGIIIVVNDKEIVIEDANGRNWVVDAKKASKARKVKLVVGERIKILGHMIDQENFSADIVRPWGNNL